MVVKYDDQILKVTVSIGASHTTHRRHMDSTEFIRQADTALYKSKDSGRNKSTMYNPGLYFVAKTFFGEDIPDKSE